MTDHKSKFRSVAGMMGIPQPDKDGTFMITHEVRDGEVRLLCKGHPFVVCKIKDGDPVVQVADCDVGVVYEHSIQTLAWRR